MTTMIIAARSPEVALNRMDWTAMFLPAFDGPLPMMTDTAAKTAVAAKGSWRIVSEDGELCARRIPFSEIAIAPTPPSRWWGGIAGSNPAPRQPAAHRNTPARPPIPNGLRTPQEVAARLGMSVKQVKTLALKDGELRFINTGRGTQHIRMMFTDADVEDFIKRRAKRNTPQQQSPTQKGTSHRAAEVIGFTARRLMNKKQKAD